MAKADFEKAKSLFPSTELNEKEWLIIVDANPDIMWHILGDIYDVLMAEEDKAKGIRSMGRRPARTGVSLEKLYATIFPPAFSMEPFPAALKNLMTGKSQRQFAMRVPCNQSTLSRLLSGEMKPDITMLERVAAAAKVNPAYFMEWRALYLAKLIEHAFLQRPNLSVMAVRNVRNARAALVS